MRKHQLQFFGVRKNGDSRVRVLTIPLVVLADRDRRASLVPRDLTAMLMGDPPAGWRQVVPASRSIVHDKLDDLIFRV